MKAIKKTFPALSCCVVLSRLRKPHILPTTLRMGLQWMPCLEFAPHIFRWCVGSTNNWASFIFSHENSRRSSKRDAHLTQVSLRDRWEYSTAICPSVSIQYTVNAMVAVWGISPLVGADCSHYLSQEAGGACETVPVCWPGSDRMEHVCTMPQAVGPHA